MFLANGQQQVPIGGGQQQVHASWRNLQFKLNESDPVSVFDIQPVTTPYLVIEAFPDITETDLIFIIISLLKDNTIHTYTIIRIITDVEKPSLIRISRDVYYDENSTTYIHPIELRTNAANRVARTTLSQKFHYEHYHAFDKLNRQKNQNADIQVEFIRSAEVGLWIRLMESRDKQDPVTQRAALDALGRTDQNAVDAVKKITSKQAPLTNFRLVIGISDDRLVYIAEVKEENDSTQVVVFCTNWSLERLVFIDKFSKFPPPPPGKTLKFALVQNLNVHIGYADEMMPERKHAEGGNSKKKRPAAETTTSPAPESKKPAILPPYTICNPIEPLPSFDQDTQRLVDKDISFLWLYDPVFPHDVFENESIRELQPAGELEDLIQVPPHVARYQKGKQDRYYNNRTVQSLYGTLEANFTSKYLYVSDKEVRYDYPLHDYDPNSFVWYVDSRSVSDASDPLIFANVVDVKFLMTAPPNKILVVDLKYPTYLGIFELTGGYRLRAATFVTEKELFVTLEHESDPTLVQCGFYKLSTKVLELVIENGGPDKLTYSEQVGHMQLGADIHKMGPSFLTIPGIIRKTSSAVNGMLLFCRTSRRFDYKLYWAFIAIPPGEVDEDDDPYYLSAIAKVSLEDLASVAAFSLTAGTLDSTNNSEELLDGSGPKPIDDGLLQGPQSMTTYDGKTKAEDEDFLEMKEDSETGNYESAVMVALANKINVGKYLWSSVIVLMIKWGKVDDQPFCEVVETIKNGLVFKDEELDRIWWDTLMTRKAQGDKRLMMQGCRKKKLYISMMNLGGEDDEGRTVNRTKQIAQL